MTFDFRPKPNKVELDFLIVFDFHSQLGIIKSRGTSFQHGTGHPMANRAYLVGSSNAAPAGPNEMGINYNPDTEILAGASYHIPIFWLSLFEESHIKLHIVQDCRIPAPVCEASVARQLLQRRRARVLEAFSRCDAHWQAWDQLITEASFPFFKFDGTELWDLDPEWFESNLAPAIRWFSSGSQEDFAKLLSMAQVGYEISTRTPKISEDGGGRSDSVGHHLHGYAWVRDVPWTDR